MAPVHSPTAPSFRTRRRHVSPTTAGLFPEFPDAKSPKQVVQSPARAEDRRGSISDRETTDCPPASTTQSGNQNREKGPVRNDAAVPPQRANARLVGIARLAAFSPPAETRRKSAEKPEYFVLPVKSILNRCDSDRVPFEWTINPYRGCEFACKYCYARYTHEYMELDGAEFEKKIYVKKDAAPLLAWDVAHKYSYTSEASDGARPDHIAIGTATDPYQPAEREYGVTRACLEELAKREGMSISIITKSKQFLPFVREKFPRLAKQYEQWFAKNGYAPEEYRRKASERLARIREKYGFRSRPWMENKRKATCSQLSLGWDAAARTMEQTQACATG